MMPFEPMGLVAGRDMRKADSRRVVQAANWVINEMDYN